jgi:hypothetical protein
LVKKPIQLDVGSQQHASVGELLGQLEQVAELVFFQLWRRGVVPQEVENASTRAAYLAWLEQQGRSP